MRIEKENSHQKEKQEVIEKLYEAALDYEKKSLNYEREKLLKHIKNLNNVSKE